MEGLEVPTMPTMPDMTTDASLNEEIVALTERRSEIRAARSDLNRRYRDARRLYHAGVQELDAAEKRVQRALQDLGRRRRGETSVRASRAGGLDPHIQAGRYAETALTVFRDADGPLSQSEVGRRGGIGTGTLTHAIKALESDGLIRETGKRDGRSKVYTLTPKAKRTRRRAGS